MASWTGIRVSKANHKSGCSLAGGGVIFGGVPGSICYITSCVLKKKSFACQKLDVYIARDIARSKSALVMVGVGVVMGRDERKEKETSPAILYVPEAPFTQTRVTHKLKSALM